MENKVSGRNSDGGVPVEDKKPRGRGRPRKWATARERKQAAAARQRERVRHLEALYLALVNARWEDPELQRAIASGQDDEILAALTSHFRQRHWMQRKPDVQAVRDPTNPPPR
jgi:hypothetical protein